MYIATRWRTIYSICCDCNAELRHWSYA